MIQLINFIIKFFVLIILMLLIAPLLTLASLIMWDRYYYDLIDNALEHLYD